MVDESFFLKEKFSYNRAPGGKIFPPMSPLKMKLGLPSYTKRPSLFGLENTSLVKDY